MPPRHHPYLKERELVPSSGVGPITSRNRPVGGESGRCENNKLNTLIYGYGPESWVYNKYLSQFTADQFIWFFYDDPYTEPNSYTPVVSNPIEENSFKVVTFNYKFTDSSKHDVLGVRIPTNNKKGYTDYKIKFAPKISNTNSIAPLWFYIEEFEGTGKPMRKKWGDLATSLSESQHAAIYGVSSFGKINNDIDYLRSL